METVEFHSYSDDVVESKNQNYKVPDSYQWVREERWFRFCSAVLYRIFKAAGAVYCKCVLHVSIRNREVLKQSEQTGYFLFANHTQPVGDVFLPALAVSPKRIYTAASSSNMGIPVIGRLLPFVGILPAPENLEQMKEFKAAIDRRIQEKNCVVIYPEAHVWPYYTEIRPFPDTSFRFPAEAGAPVFCMTTTYQRRRFGKKPKTTVYLDGPFYAEEGVHPKIGQRQLKEAVFACMQERSKENQYEYVHYMRGRDA